MGLLDAGDCVLDLFAGKDTDRARRGALLVGAVLLANRPEMLKIVVDGKGGGR